MLKKPKMRTENKTIQSVFVVVAGNIALLLAKCFLWLIIPKLLGVAEYGYYKTFTLYLTYAMFLHFGFPDGILLIYGGKDYEDINKREFCMYSRFFLIFLGAISLLCVIGGFIVKGVDKYLFFMLGADAFFINMATYFKFISQAVMRFGELTKRNMLEAVLQVASVIVFGILSRLHVIEANGKMYIMFLVAIDAFILLWYIPKYHDFIFGIREKISWAKIMNIFRVGILLTMAFQISHLVFVLDRQMVSILFPVTTYSLYSFAYSITNLITATIGAVAVVLFPKLKRLETDRMMMQYPVFISGIAVIVFFLLSCYYPMTFFIRWFLPEYVDSVRYIKIIFPGLAISSCINIVIFTYYKVLKRLKQYLFISLALLGIGFLFNISGYILCQDPAVFSVASILTLLVWYFVSQKYMIEGGYKVDFCNYAYVCIMIGWFYFVSYIIKMDYIAMMIYLVGFFLITFVYKTINTIRSEKNKL